MKFKPLLPISVVLLALFLTTVFFLNKNTSLDESSVSFLVAGHIYGSPQGENLEMDPLLFQELNVQKKYDYDFLVLTGDTVRQSNEDHWQKTLSQLDQWQKPYYLVMGNHDNSKEGEKIFRKKYGRTYYHFTNGKNLFIILNTQIKRGRIPIKQQRYVKKTLNKYKDANNVFIFIHELIWTAHREEYRQLIHNQGSYDPYFESNFWDEFYPLLTQFPQKEIYIVAGDLGAHPQTLGFYREDRAHIHFLASGVGDSPHANYLTINVPIGSKPIITPQFYKR